MNAMSPQCLRKTILRMAYSGSTVHIGCAFSIVEVLSVLYEFFVRYPDNDPQGPERDYLVLSKGHGVMAQYACMKELGWLDESDIQNYFGDGTSLKGLSDSRVRGLEVTSGSLGHGLSVGVGLALGAKLKKSDQKVYAIVGDGEANEGSIWEALQFASHHQLNNLLVIFDVNAFQAMGPTQEILFQGSLTDKLKAFGFETAEGNGHDTKKLRGTIQELVNSQRLSPKAFVANTIKGKGVSFMEANNEWHYRRLDQQTYQKALAEIEACT